MPTDTEIAMTRVRDGASSAAVALSYALVVWLVPFGGVPILALLTGPLALVLLGFSGCAPVLIGDFRLSLGRTLAGAGTLLVAGQLTSFGTLWIVSTAHGIALGFGRGSIDWPTAALQLLPSLSWLVVPWVLFVVGLATARGLGPARAAAGAAVLVAVAPLAANVLLLYAWLGLPLTA